MSAKTPNKNSSASQPLRIIEVAKKLKIHSNEVRRRLADGLLEAVIFRNEEWLPVHEKCIERALVAGKDEFKVTYWQDCAKSGLLLSDVEPVAFDDLRILQSELRPDESWHNKDYSELNWEGVIYPCKNLKARTTLKYLNEYARETYVSLSDILHEVTGQKMKGSVIDFFKNKPDMKIYKSFVDASIHGRYKLMIPPKMEK